VCEQPFSKGEFDKSDFHGAPFESHNIFLATQTKFWEVPNTGNTKEISILDGNGGLAWSENVTNRLFVLERGADKAVSKGWLLPPTQAMVLNLNIYNEEINTLLLFRLITVKTEAGLYELDY